MVVGVLTLDLILHAPQNLKEKRGMVKKLQGRLRNRFPVSCAETGYHDLWQRSQLGLTMVDCEQPAIERTFRLIEEEVARSGLAEVSDTFVEYLHY